MPISIPSAHHTHRYHGQGDQVQGARVDLAGAFRAFADDLLDSGDPRLALERAFRWGYRNEEGDHVPGLQELLQDLRHQRDRLTRQIEDETFLEAVASELDRLDEIDLASSGGKEKSSSHTAIDRLAERLEQGYASSEAQAGLDALVEELRQRVAGEQAGMSGERGPGQAGSGMGHMRSARSASAERVRRMLFDGGSQSNDRTPASGAWRADSRLKDAANRALLDLQTLADLDRVERQLEQLSAIGSVTQLSELDVERLAGVGDDQSEWLGAWVDAVKTARGGAGGSAQITLPPGVIRAIGQDLLKGLFRAASSPSTGEHQSMMPGNAGDSVEGTIPWEPGRPLDLHLVATLSNAVRRSGSEAKGRIRLQPDDFAVVERTATTAVSTVLAIDRSRSMGQSGAWTSAKKVSLAMHELIRQSYPRDSLEVIAFSSGAERVPFESIPEMRWDEFEHGTHLQAALALGRRMLRRNRVGTRQIVVITDGEPTLATIGGEDVFSSPPSDEILNATMAEVIRCTREQIVINVVMLGASDTTSTFAEQVARVNRGRIFAATAERLGEYIIRDYVAG